ncbi:MAG TPA: hypothetical protein VHT96_03430 [Clostridia bacterium]|nr:hypothetical protein [Clostridia bacterium]
MKKRIFLLCVAVLMMFVLLTGCVPGDGTYSADKPAGFFWGIWHGWIAPISLIMGLFRKGIRVYETMNSGWWYDFGFYIAIISGFGGLSLFRHKSRSDNCSQKKNNQ